MMSNVVFDLEPLGILRSAEKRCFRKCSWAGFELAVHEKGHTQAPETLFPVLRECKEVKIKVNTLQLYPIEKAF